MKNNNKKTLKKLAILVIGSIIAAYGITLALYAGFGGATLAVLWQGIARTFHISIGTASFAVALGMILFANCHIYSTYKWINFLIMLLGVVLFAVGTGLYASASLGRGSYEAVTFALAEKNHWQIKFVRMALDILVVVTGVLFGGKFGVCTLITVIISGPIIQFVNAKAKQVLKI